MKPNHGGNPETSSRLQRTLAALQPAGTIRSGAEIAARTKSMAVHSDIDDLRKAEIPVSKAIYLGKSRTGRRVFGYRLLG